MRLNDALDGITRLGLDTPPIIYLIEQHPAYLPLVRPVFQQISAGTVSGFTSVMTLVEVLTLPLARGYGELAQQYRHVLLGSHNFLTVDITTPVAERAADLRARYRLRTPDALQLAAALAHGCQAFLTNDRDLVRVAELRMIVIDELEP